jgi:hypothetical protein
VFVAVQISFPRGIRDRNRRRDNSTGIGFTGGPAEKRHVNMTISPTFRAGSASVSPSFFLTTPAKTLRNIRGSRTAMDPLVPRRALR